jgi:hypothetical protein
MTREIVNPENDEPVFGISFCGPVYEAIWAA